MNVLWLDEPGVVVAYDPALHAQRVWNFLFWRGLRDDSDLLIAGDGEYEHKSGASHMALAQRVREVRPDVPMRKPEGAGNTNLHGQCTDWTSIGFNVTTPSELRPMILQALGLQEMEKPKS